MKKRTIRGIAFILFLSAPLLVYAFDPEEECPKGPDGRVEYKEARDAPSLSAILSEPTSVGDKYVVCLDKNRPVGTGSSISINNTTGGELVVYGLNLDTWCDGWSCPTFPLLSIDGHDIRIEAATLNNTGHLSNVAIVIGNDARNVTIDSAQIDGFQIGIRGRGVVKETVFTNVTTLIENDLPPYPIRDGSGNISIGKRLDETGEYVVYIGGVLPKNACIEGATAEVYARKRYDYNGLTDVWSRAGGCRLGVLKDGERLCLYTGTGTPPQRSENETAEEYRAKIDDCVKASECRCYEDGCALACEDLKENDTNGIRKDRSIAISYTSGGATREFSEPLLLSNIPFTMSVATFAPGVPTDDIPSVGGDDGGHAGSSSGGSGSGSGGGSGGIMPPVMSAPDTPSNAGYEPVSGNPISHAVMPKLGCSLEKDIGVDPSSMSLFAILFAPIIFVGIKRLSGLRN